MLKLTIDTYLLNTHPHLIYSRSLYFGQLIRMLMRTSILTGHCFINYFSIRRLLSKGYNVVFYGSDQFSLPSLINLKNSQENGLVSRLTVVSRNNSLVSTFATNNNLPFIQWQPNYLINKYDVGFVVSFGHLLPLEAIEQCTYGIINIHASLLPRWRGASPIHHAILAGDEITGVTVMKIDPDKFDTGDVLSYHEYKMPQRPQFSTVFKDLAQLASKAIVETLTNLPTALENAKPQSNVGITKAPKPKPVDGFINFKQLTSIEVDRRVRALNGLITCYTHWIDGTQLRLYNVNDPSITETAQIDELLKDEFGLIDVGSIFYHQIRRQLCFKCADSRWISFSSVGPEGRKVMNSMDFYNGFISKLLVSEKNKVDNNCIVKIPRNRMRKDEGRRTK